MSGANRPNGTACLGGVCNNGTCTPCTQGASCSANPNSNCALGVVQCGTGTPVCVDGAPARATPPSIAPWYTCPLGAVTQTDFETLLGRTIEPVAIPKPGRYTLACTFQDMRASFIIRQVIKGIEGTVAKGLGHPGPDDPTYKMILSSSLNTPLKNLSLVSPESMPRHMTHGLVDLANGRWLRGIWTLLTKTVPER